MALKWSKRIAVEYIQQMKSPIEEMAPAPTTDKLGRLRLAGQKLLTRIGQPKVE